MDCRRSLGELFGFLRNGSDLHVEQLLQAHLLEFARGLHWLVRLRQATLRKQSEGQRYNGREGSTKTATALPLPRSARESFQRRLVLTIHLVLESPLHT